MLWEYKKPTYIQHGTSRVCTSILAYCPLVLRVESYTGCEHACSACYALNSRSNRHCVARNEVWIRDLKPFERQMEWAFDKAPSDDDSWEVKLLRRKFPVQVAVMTDGFQPVEREAKNTLHIMEAFNKHGVRYYLSTKGLIPLEEPWFSTIVAGQPCFRVSVGFPKDEATSRKWEPNAPPPAERLAMAKRFKDAGVFTLLRLAPFYPGESLENLKAVEPFVEKAAECCHAIVIEFLNYKQNTTQRNFVFERSNFDLHSQIKDKTWFTIGTSGETVWDPNLMREWLVAFADAANDYGIYAAGGGWLTGFCCPDLTVTDRPHCCYPRDIKTGKVWPGFDEMPPGSLMVRYFKKHGVPDFTLDTALDPTDTPERPMWDPDLPCADEGDYPAWVREEADLTLEMTNYMLGVNEDMEDDVDAAPLADPQVTVDVFSEKKAPKAARAPKGKGPSMETKFI